jgi:hypothetical protein
MAGERGTATWRVNDRRANCTASTLITATITLRELDDGYVKAGSHGEIEIVADDSGSRERTKANGSGAVLQKSVRDLYEDRLVR